MKKKITIATILILVALLMLAGRRDNQWILFFDKEITGFVVDVDTHKPIEGAITIVMWPLVQVPGEGFGGYAKISVAETDKNGNFVIGPWVTLKPWKLCSVMHGLAPKIVIYKPGYKLYTSHKVVSRRLFPFLSDAAKRTLCLRSSGIPVYSFVMFN